MTHTPGPWSIKIGARTFYIHGSEDTYIIAEAHRNYADPQRESNAQLIAAAPETAAERDRLKAINASLVDALISMLNVEGAAVAGRDAAQAWKGLDVKWHFNKARAVLAKANETQL